MLIKLTFGTLYEKLILTHKKSFKILLKFPNAYIFIYVSLKNSLFGYSIRDSWFTYKAVSNCQVVIIILEFISSLNLSPYGTFRLKIMQC